MGEERTHHEGTKDTKGSDIILLNFVRFVVRVGFVR